MLRRPASCPTQASLLRIRGNLRDTRTSFNARLSKPSPVRHSVVRPGDTGLMKRSGMDLHRIEVKPRLLVADVDIHPRNRTPVAQWNASEERQAHRGDYEYASLAIQPGDRISAVNDFATATGMLSEIEDAMSMTHPKTVNLTVSRDISDVMTMGASPRTPGVAQPPQPKAPGTLAARPPRPSGAVTSTDWLSRQCAGDDSLPGQTRCRSRGMRFPEPASKSKCGLRFSSPGCSEASTRSPSVSSRSTSASRSRGNMLGGAAQNTRSSPVLMQAGSVACEGSA